MIDTRHHRLALLALQQPHMPALRLVELAGFTPATARAKGGAILRSERVRAIQAQLIAGGAVTDAPPPPPAAKPRRAAPQPPAAPPPPAADGLSDIPPHRVAAIQAAAVAVVRPTPAPLDLPPVAVPAIDFATATQQEVRLWSLEVLKLVAADGLNARDRRSVVAACAELGRVASLHTQNVVMHQSPWASIPTARLVEMMDTLDAMATMAATGRVEFVAARSPEEVGVIIDIEDDDAEQQQEDAACPVSDPLS